MKTPFQVYCDMPASNNFFRDYSKTFEFLFI